MIESAISADSSSLLRILELVIYTLGSGVSDVSRIENDADLIGSVNDCFLDKIKVTFSVPSVRSSSIIFRGIF